MSWIDRQPNWLGRKPGKPEPAPRELRERLYTVQEVADVFRVDKRTVLTWLAGDEDAPPVIPAEAWFKLPGSGYIRIREWIVLQLLKNQMEV